MGRTRAAQNPASFSTSFLVPNSEATPQVSATFHLKIGRKILQEVELTALTLQETPNAGFKSSGQFPPSSQSQLENLLLERPIEFRP